MRTYTEEIKIRIAKKLKTNKYSILEKDVINIMNKNYEYYFNKPIVSNDLKKGFVYLNNYINDNICNNGFVLKLLNKDFCDFFLKKNIDNILVILNKDNGGYMRHIALANKMKMSYSIYISWRIYEEISNNILKKILDNIFADFSALINYSIEEEII